MSTHNNYLGQIGMVTNVDKTELLYFSRQKIRGPTLTVNNKQVSPSETLKVLGVKFQPDLSWDTHIRETISRLRFIIKKLHFVKKYLTLPEMIKIVTSHFYSVLYYAAPVWLTSNTKSIHWKLLNSIHYRAMRAVIGDFYNQISRRDVDRIGQRSTPYQWMLYCNTKMAITLTNLGLSGPRLSDKLRKRCYVNDRMPGIGYFQDYSRLKIGRNSLVNRLPMLRKVKFQWTSGINNHTLRQNLKKLFFVKA